MCGSMKGSMIEKHSLWSEEYPNIKFTLHYKPYKYQFGSVKAAMLLTEDVLDKLSVSLMGEELDTMQKLYHQALKLELEFFLSLPVDQQTVFPLSKQHIST
ncbi:putative heme oxygenase-like, multi-helical [Helianthus annuus]|nr:putative heme oxygenase-like, multi-helical [Helianthus annuus]KAJ0838513.1 putative heme oxygenase-like, multi-helical [Helianthus annuus]